jgi:plasmid stabilization system protein ParE
MRIRVSGLARADIVQAFEWYLPRNPDSAAAFVHAVDAVIHRIALFPKSGRPHVMDTRVCKLRGFPYLIYYRELESDVLVLGVMHTSLDPSTIDSRLGTDDE